MIIIQILFAIACYCEAKKKHYNEWLAAICGFFFTFIAGIIYLFLPSKNKDNTIL